MSSAAQPVSGVVADLSSRRAPSLTATDIGRSLDLGEMTDEEFNNAVQTMERRTVRVKRIMETFLVVDVHYGNPKNEEGRKAFKKPILYQTGAQHLRGIFGYTPVYVLDPEVTLTAEFVSVRVTIALRDRNGRLSAPRSGVCTSHEKRFHKYNGKGFTWKDAREVYHDCMAMAEKRASGLSTIETLGLGGHFEVEDKKDDGVLEKWTPAEKSRVVDAAKAKGITTRGAFRQLLLDTLGREQVGSGEDVEKLLKAIAEWKGSTPPNGGGNGTGGTATDASTATDSGSSPSSSTAASGAAGEKTPAPQPTTTPKSDGRPTATTPIEFGPHKGKLITQVPPEYLAELVSTPRKVPEIWKAVVEAEVDRRENPGGAKS